MNITYDQWLKDTTILSHLRTSWNDKLEVTNDGLHFEVGQHSRIMGRSITNDPTGVANYLESLITNFAHKYFQTLQLSKNDTPAYYEEVADFKRQVNYVRKRTSDLQYIFRSFDCNNPSHAERYSQLYEIVYKFVKEVKQYKGTLKEPPLEERPVKHIQYNERTEMREIKWSYPKRVPVEEIVLAAKQALLLAQPQQRPLVKCIKAIGEGLLFGVPFVAASLLTALKIFLLNPLEWLFKGEIRTISPIRWLLQEIKSHNRHMIFYQNFCTRLLQQPIISEKVVNAFKQLAPKANLLSLERALLASEDITELAPYIKEDQGIGPIPLVTYLNIMKRLCKENNIELKTLDSVKDYYNQFNRKFLKFKKENEKQSIEDFLQVMVAHLPKKADVKGFHRINPYISPKALQELLNAASTSPTCREISLSDSLIELQFVRNFLSSHSYRLKDEKDKNTYRRYSLI